MNTDQEEKILGVIGYRSEGVFKLHGFDSSQLVQFAEQRHGWGDSNGGFGVTYPGDLDEYDKEVEKINIPDGYIEIYGFWGAKEGGYELVVKEYDYLDKLLQVLIDLKQFSLAERIKKLIETTTNIK